MITQKRKKFKHQLNKKEQKAAFFLEKRRNVPYNISTDAVRLQALLFL